MDYSLKEEVIESFFQKIKSFILPSEDNNYKSRFLQSNILLYCVVLLLAIKIATILVSTNIPQNIFFADITKSALENFVNQTRQASGLNTLAENEKLNQAAQLKAENMVQDQYFNHTSPRRGETFVEQKIVQAAVNIKKGKQESLQLGNMYSYRDFGHAKDFIHAMWLMMQQKQPDDYVISSGLKYMIKDIVNMVFSKLDMELEWSGDGKDEKGTLKNSDRVLVSINPKYFRPLEVDSLLGDSTLARSKLGWTPKYTFDDILNEMIEEEMKK